ncbi:hypothetical protein [Bradyrhizobium commune]|uniref:Uncharacterized protein n=1 Tax=Bradyrhizobium commune TaxID=83627 RepID=A0A7S9DCW7_9BRAD|nr:hypothetical protein [Bradyrhizobium commune]QPF95447.1 hypothetical protein IC761_14260 [Bradyrhizobium commune]
MIATMPFLLSLVSRNSKAIAPCLLTSIFTVLFIGVLMAAVAVRERLRVL